MDKTNSKIDNKIKNDKLIKKLTWKEMVMFGWAALASISSKGNKKP